MIATNIRNSRASCPIEPFDQESGELLCLIDGNSITEAAGAEFVLLSCAPTFYREGEDDIYNYTKAVCDATNLAVMIFPMFLWDFAPRVHPSDIPTLVIRRLVDDCPNLAAIKGVFVPTIVYGAASSQRTRYFDHHCH